MYEIALRIREMREISGFTTVEMAEKTEVSVEEYNVYESGNMDFPFSFLHKCANAFGIEITKLIKTATAAHNIPINATFVFSFIVSPSNPQSNSI